MTETGGQKIIKIEQFIKRTAKRPRDIQIDAAEQTVFQLGQPGAESRAVLGGIGSGKGKADCQIADTEGTLRITTVDQAVKKGFEHTGIGERNGDLHGQIARLAKVSHIKAGQPPAHTTYGKEKPAFVKQLHGHIQHFLIRYTVEQRPVILLRGEDAICMINADLPTCIDPILPLPEFDQPGLTMVVKIDRFTVKDHIEVGRGLVKESTITEFALPGVLPGGNDILIQKIGKTERAQQFVQCAYFFAVVHVADLTDDVLFPVMIQNTENNTEKDKESEKEIHGAVLFSVYLSYAVG